jgi:tetratricopeptide (TPR) repeat protein
MSGYMIQYKIAARRLGFLLVAFLLKPDGWCDDQPGGTKSPEIKQVVNRQRDLWKKNEDAAAQARKASRYDEAENFYLAAILATGDLAPLQSQQVESLGGLASLCCQRGRYTLAEPLARQALAIQDKQFGSNHVESAQFRALLGLICGHDGKFPEAEQQLLAAKSVFVSESGENHPTVANCLDQLGMIYLMQDRIADAERMFKNALEILRKPKIVKDVVASGDFKNPSRGRVNITVFEPSPALIADVLDNLGTAFRKQGKLDEAGQCLGSALAFCEDYYGKKNPLIVSELNNLASVRMAQKDFHGAEPLLRRSLAIEEKRLGAKDPALLPVLFSLAQVYREQKQEKAADETERRIRDLRAASPVNPN